MGAANGTAVGGACNGTAWQSKGDNVRFHVPDFKTNIDRSLITRQLLNPKGTRALEDSPAWHGLSTGLQGGSWTCWASVAVDMRRKRPC